MTHSYIPAMAKPGDTYDNPAGRLYKLLERGKKANPRRAAHEVWAELLGVKRGHIGELYRRLAMLSELPDAAENAMVELRGQDAAAGYLGWSTSVRKLILNRNLDASWESVIKGVPAEDMARLELCSQELSGTVERVSFFNEAGIEKFREHVRAAADEARNESNLEPKVRSFLLRVLRHLEYALDEYQIRGMEAFREAEIKFASDCALSPEVAERASKSAVWKNVKKFFIGLNVLLRVVGQSYLLGRALQEDFNNPPPEVAQFLTQTGPPPPPQLPKPEQT